MTEDNEGNDRLVKITSTKALKNLCKGVFRSVFLSQTQAFDLSRRKVAGSWCVEAFIME